MTRSGGQDRGRAPVGAERLRRSHARHAERLRTAARWLGIDDDAREAATLRCFAALDEAVPEDSAATWAALMRALAREAPSDPPPQPCGAAEAALLGFLARRPGPERAVFALAELGGFDAIQLAEAIGAPPAAGQALITGLRRAFAGDPAVIAGGGPAVVLTACLAVDRPPPGWQRASLQALEDMFPGPAEGGVPRAAIVAIVGLAVGVLLVLWPGAPPEAEEVPAEEAAPAQLPERPKVHAVSEPEPTPPPPTGPPLLGEPKDRAQEPGGTKPVVVVKKKPREPARRKEALAQRAEQAAARDPGNIIVELEMLGAAKRALTTSPLQALGYADQHAQEYPNSQLVDQRAEVRVRALCRLGRKAEAQAEAQRRGSARVQAALRETCGG